MSYLWIDGVSSVAVSWDGLRVAACTTNGSLGVLHVSDQTYQVWYAVAWHVQYMLRTCDALFNFSTSRWLTFVTTRSTEARLLMLLFLWCATVCVLESHQNFNYYRSSEVCTGKFPRSQQNTALSKFRSVPRKWILWEITCYSRFLRLKKPCALTKFFSLTLNLHPPVSTHYTFWKAVKQDEQFQNRCLCHFPHFP